MMGTINCTYETPCGWCTKWDKKCDKKLGRGTNADTSKQDLLDLDAVLEQKGMKRYDQPRSN